ncbi:hypothetical protein AK830_g7912 [Neonectria ditissima]|uniref:Methyltransferase type 11 domain-containing protein n=1 Tax=Neonectria ditissima TaxID=78410 RepID=A0A0P7BCL2_9HYPO|nr:hypothetical protein AK830_g7912 [Neonectria ditissima]
MTNSEPDRPADSPESSAKSSPKSQTPSSKTPSPEPTVGVLPAEHWTQLPQGDNGHADSVGYDVESSTASINSSILEYRTIHGRTYHSDQGNAQYWATNDEQQNESMDINDFADEFPGAEIVGTDVSPIQPGWVPPNLKFEIEDCTREWTFAPGSVDYVHIRWLVGSIPDWSALFAQAYQCCRPGGWFESLETSPVIECDDDTGAKKLRTSFTVVQDGVQKRAMEEAGFVDIQEFDFNTPLGGWPKDETLRELGRFAQLTIESDIEGYVLFMANTLG